MYTPCAWNDQERVIIVDSLVLSKESKLLRMLVGRIRGVPYNGTGRIRIGRLDSL
jgi:hypothetical protein